MRKHNKSITYTVKMSVSPVSGYKCYSVFRDGELYFTRDGEKISVFEDEVIESFTLPDYPQYRIYRIEEMLFTGLLPLTQENLSALPAGCSIYSGVQNTTKGVGSVW